MYNEEIKERFLNEKTQHESIKRVAGTLFEALGKYESEWNADFYTMDLDSIRPVIGELVGFRKASQENQLSILREYIRWCHSQGFDNVSDAIFEIDTSRVGLDKLKRQMVANPRHLQRYLDCICDPESLETVDCIFRCYYWLAYGGVSNQETAVDINKKDVNLNVLEVVHDGVVYDVYKEAIPAYKNCIELSSFRLNNPRYYEEIRRDRPMSEKLLSGTRGPRSPHLLRCDLSRLAREHKRCEVLEDNLDLNLSYYRVWLSGVFYRYLEMERAGVPADFKPLVWDVLRANKKKRNDNSKVDRDYVNKLSKSYKEDYERWKEVYSI